MSFDLRIVNLIATALIAALIVTIAVVAKHAQEAEAAAKLELLQ